MAVITVLARTVTLRRLALRRLALCRLALRWLALRRLALGRLTLRRAVLAAVAAGAAALLSACGASKPAPAPTVTVTASSPAASASPAAVAATPPAVVAVTTRGALVVLNPATGAVTKTLVSSGVLGDEISVSSSGMVYFAVKNGCSSKIEDIPAAGGSAAVIAPAGSLPAVSPDGTKLAYADQPSLTVGCVPGTPNLVPLYHLEVRTLSSGATASLPMAPASEESGLPAIISHLSWAPDSVHIAVSITPTEDNEGWNVVLVDTASAQGYFGGAGTTYVPVTGSPSKRDSYLREAAYLPDGNLFVSRACCTGIPIRNTSRLLWEVTPSGALIHQVAIGYPTLVHDSLSVSPDGDWLLYVAGTSLYVSEGGATPREITTGLIAAAWG